MLGCEVFVRCGICGIREEVRCDVEQTGVGDGGGGFRCIRAVRFCILQSIRHGILY